jgi:hypothetical protein
MSIEFSLLSDVVRAAAGEIDYISGVLAATRETLASLRACGNDTSKALDFARETIKVVQDDLERERDLHTVTMQTLEGTRAALAATNEQFLLEREQNEYTKQALDATTADLTGSHRTNADLRGELHTFKTLHDAAKMELEAIKANALANGGKLITVPCLPVRGDAEAVNDACQEAADHAMKAAAAGWRPLPSETPPPRHPWQQKPASGPLASQSYPSETGPGTCD